MVGRENSFSIITLPVHEEVLSSPSPHERLRDLVEGVKIKLSGHYGGGGLIAKVCSKFESKYLISPGSHYMPLSKRKISKSVSRDIGEAITKLFSDHEMRLDTSTTSNIQGVVLDILREEWSSIDYKEAKEKNIKTRKFIREVKEKAYSHLRDVLDDCLLGFYDNPIKELRKLKEMRWLKYSLSQYHRS